MKKTTSLLIIAAIATSLSACNGAPPAESLGIKSSSISSSSSTLPSPIPFDLAEYKSQVLKCRTAIMEEALLLNNMGKFQYNYWETLAGIGGKMDYEKLVIKGKEWLDENAEGRDTALEDNYKEISDQYTEILKVEPTNTEAEEIRTNFKELFSSYDKMYQLVTSPSGSLDDFAADFNTYNSDIKSYDSLLSKWVEK